MKSLGDVVISGVGFVSFLGEGSELLEDLESNEKIAPKEERVAPEIVLPVGRLGRLRRHHFRKRFERMTQLDAFSQYAFVASGYALDDARVPAPDPRFEEMGVLLGSAFGCQEANYKFDQFVLDAESGPEGARPALFKNTVDNVPAGWVALGYELRGINATYVSGPGAGAEAMLAAFWALEEKRAGQVLAGGVERLLPMQVAAQHRGSRRPLPFVSEGAAVVLLERMEAAETRGSAPRKTAARLVTATRISNISATALGEFLEGVDCTIEDMGMTSLVALSATRQNALGLVLAEAGLVVPPVIESAHTGQMFAAQAPLALMLLIERLRRGADKAGLLVVAGERNEAFLFLVAMD